MVLGDRPRRASDAARVRLRIHEYASSRPATATRRAGRAPAVREALERWEPRIRGGRGRRGLRPVDAGTLYIDVNIHRADHQTTGANGLPLYTIPSGRGSGKRSTD
ncbi:hypothetical protein GCM10019017_20760 [Streptomyces showdoensis]